MSVVREDSLPLPQVSNPVDESRTSCIVRPCMVINFNDRNKALFYEEKRCESMMKQSLEIIIAKDPPATRGNPTPPHLC